MEPEVKKRSKLVRKHLFVPRRMLDVFERIETETDLPLAQIIREVMQDGLNLGRYK